MPGYYAVFTWMSGNTCHISSNEHMAGIGPEAKAFQGHHYDPTAVARGNWMDFLREHHSLVFLVMASYIFIIPWFDAKFDFLWQSHNDGFIGGLIKS